MIVDMQRTLFKKVRLASTGAERTPPDNLLRFSLLRPQP
jgi:hypothetical protein